MNQPHILFINTDQLRPDFLGCYGFPAATSPAIDALAREGVLATGMYTQSPICVPARYSLTTGQYVSRHGALTNYRQPYPQTRSLIESITRQGYHTICVGKLHLIPVDARFGFAEVHLHDGTFRERRPFSVYSRWLQEQGVDEDDLAYAADVDTVPAKRSLKNRVHWGRCRLADE